MPHCEATRGPRSATFQLAALDLEPATSERSTREPRGTGRSGRGQAARPASIDTVEEALDFLAGLVLRASVAFLDLSGEDFRVALDLVDGGVALTGLQVLQRLVTLTRVAGAGVRGTIRGRAGIVVAVHGLAARHQQDGQ